MTKQLIEILKDKEEEFSLIKLNLSTLSELIEEINKGIKFEKLCEEFGEGNITETQLQIMRKFWTNDEGMVISFLQNSQVKEALEVMFENFMASAEILSELLKEIDNAEQKLEEARNKTQEKHDA